MSPGPRVITVDCMSPSAAALAAAVEALRAGQVVAFPTDTLYGLAVDPTSPAAVERLYAAKGRDPGVAVPLIAADAGQVETIAVLGAVERRLAEHFWPGPLSIVVPAREVLCQSLLGPGRTVAVRVPAHTVARALAAAAGRPITATSANRSGQPAAADAGAVIAAMGQRIAAVIDAGATAGGPPSTIVEVVDGLPRCLRHGAVPWDRVLEFLA